MTTYLLTEKQKTLLRSIAPGLKDGSVKNEWFLITGDDRILGIFGLDDDGRLWNEVWSKVTHADFEIFEQNGFLSCISFDASGFKTGYALNEAKILDAVENDFQLPPPLSTISVVSHGGVVNIQSTFQHSHQLIQNASQLDSGFKADLYALLEQLKAALVEVPDDYADEVEAVTIEASRLAEDLSRDKPNKRSVMISAEGLRKAAENLAGIATPVVKIAGSIIALVLKTFN